MATPSQSFPPNVTIRKGVLLGFGHPLLDITAKVTPDFLSKYNLKEDNVVLGGPEHEALIDEVVNNFRDVTYIPGGATQNAIRVAQWLLADAGSTSFMGAVGKDSFGHIMKEKIEEEGVIVRYKECDEKPTGTCIVLITHHGLNRSLVSFPGAARLLQPEHINWEIVHQSRVIYSAGFTIVANFPVVVALAEHAADYGKLFCLNLSACYVCQTQTEKLLQLIPFIDILFGNESEIKALAQTLQWQEETLNDIIVKLTSLDIHDKKRKREGHGRCVVITQSNEPVLAASTGFPEVLSFPVKKIPNDEIVDTNCAGDGFVGGFLGCFCLHGISYDDDDDCNTSEVNVSPPSASPSGRDLLTRCIKSGIFCAAQVTRCSGCDLESFKEIKVLNDRFGNAILHRKVK